MAIASSFIMTPGSTPGPSPSGKQRLYIDSLGSFITIDDEGVETAIAGIPGPQGEDGPQGDQGYQGVPGLKGDIGLTGPQGSTGPQGPQGPQGNTGFTGSQGDIGSQGPQGDTGSQGITGDTGPIGPQGIQGETGEHNINVISMSNQVSQSFVNDTLIDIEWDNLITVIGTHFNRYNNQEIVILEDGLIDVSYKLNFKTNDNDKDINLLGQVTVNNTIIDHTKTYGFLRYKCYGLYGTVTNGSSIINVLAGDVIKVQAQISKDTTFGDNRNVYTLYDESTLTIQYYNAQQQYI